MSYFDGYIPERLESSSDLHSSRAREGVDPWDDHSEILQAREENTERLKSLRLAKAAADAAAVIASAAMPNTKRKRIRV